MSDKVEVVRRSEHTGRAGMIGRWERWGPINGLLLCLAWAPMAIVIPRLPDLGSAQRVEYSGGTTSH